MYDIGKFYQAADVEDAVRALVEDPEAVVISGGSDVLIKIREGKLAGCSLVSIHGIKELEGIRMEEDGTIVIGPATTFSHITNNDIIQKHIHAGRCGGHGRRSPAAQHRNHRRQCVQRRDQRGQRQQPVLPGCGPGP